MPIVPSFWYTTHYCCCMSAHKWGVMSQEQVSRTGTSYCIGTQYLWDLITCPCPWHLFLAQHSLNICIKARGWHHPLNSKISHAQLIVLAVVSPTWTIVVSHMDGLMTVVIYTQLIYMRMIAMISQDLISRIDLLLQVLILASSAAWGCVIPVSTESLPGSWFNMKMPPYKYRKSHCGDKTILRPWR